MDELPVGGGGKGPSEFPSEQPAAQANPDADKPLEDRLVSKAWAIRKDAFEELKNKFKNLSENTKGEMNEHASNWGKYLLEANPGALEKVLECFLEFIIKTDPSILSGMQVSIIKPMVEKCLG